MILAFEASSLRVSAVLSTVAESKEHEIEVALWEYINELHTYKVLCFTVH